MDRYLPLCLTRGAHDFVLEFTAFHTAVLTISSEILTTMGSELHAKMQVKETHTNAYRQMKRNREDRHVDYKQDNSTISESQRSKTSTAQLNRNSV